MFRKPQNKSSQKILTLNRQAKKQKQQQQQQKNEEYQFGIIPLKYIGIAYNESEKYIKTTILVINTKKKKKKEKQTATIINRKWKNSYEK